MDHVRSVMTASILALAMTAASAQTGGTTVIVTDASGARLPGATVTISHEAGFLKTTAELTDRQGIVEFPVLRPGGGYAIQVSFPGFNTIRHEDVRVRINDTLVLTLQMIEDFEEQVRVTAEREVIDLEKTETSTKFSDNFISDLPVPGRFYQNILTMAPGVQDADGDGNPNVHGSRSRDFQTQVSGVSNVDPLTGQWMSRISPNSIEEMEVITAGAGVEFGRAQGGFARIIQKQGSNEHEGVLEFYWSSSKLDGDGHSTNSAAASPDFETIQPLFQVSGPVVKDRLWYRVSYERRDTEDPINVLGGIEIFTNNTENHDAQLTWQISPRNKLALQYRSDPLETVNFGISSLIPPESSLRQDRKAETYSLIWTAPYSPKVLVETTVAWQDINPGQGPTTSGVLNDCVARSNQPFLRVAQCNDLRSGVTSGSYFRAEADNRQRLTVKGQATVYAGRFWGLRHQFKLGINVENERYFRDLVQTPSLTYTVLKPSFSGEPFGFGVARIAVPQSDSVRATGTNWAVYAEDQIKPAQNLTITLGARLDREELNSEGREPFDPIAEFEAYDELVAGVDFGQYWPVSFTGYENFVSFESELQGTLCEGVPPETIGNCLELVSQAILSQNQEQLQTKRRANSINISNTNVSPFVSVAWSPGASGKTAFKATAGRHYNNIALLVPLQELEPALTGVNYEVQLQTDTAELVGGISPTINVRTVDRGLRTPYQDELTLSLEQALWPETSLRLTYISRDYRDQIQDININVNTGDFGRCFRFGGSVFLIPSFGGGEGSGQTVEDPVTGEIYEDTDPGRGDGRLDDCIGSATDGFLGVGSTPVNERQPDGLPDLYLQNPFWGDIFLVGNSNTIEYEAYVLELTRRQYRGWELQTSYTWSKAVGDGEDFFQELGNDPSLRGNVRGFQSYDQRHVVKLNATSVTPWGFRLGTAVTWQSGLPFSILREQIAFDTKPPVTSDLGGVGSRARQFYVTGVRNDQRNSPYWNVDLKATKELELGRGVNLQLSAEVYNVLDDSTYIVYNPFFESGQQVNGINEATRRFGRQWQLGMRLAF